MYVYYDDSSITFKTDGKAKEFLFNELVRYDSDFFAETLNEHYSAMDILAMVVGGKSAEEICFNCDNAVYCAASKEVSNNLNQYFDKIEDNEND